MARKSEMNGNLLTSLKTCLPANKKIRKTSTANSLPITILERIYCFFTLIGMGAHRILKSVVSLLCKPFAFLIHQHNDKVHRQKHTMVQNIAAHVKKGIRVLFLPLIKLYHAGGVIRGSLQVTKKERLAVRLQRVCRSILAGMARNKSTLTSAMNYALPLTGIAVFILVVQYVNAQTFAVSVSYNNVAFGYVQNEAVIEQAEQIVQGRMVYLDDSERMVLTPEYEVKVSAKTEMLNEFELADKIIGSSSEDIVEAEGLYIDGVFYAAVDESGDIQEKLEKILQDNKTGAEGEQVSFPNEVKIEPGIYLAKNIVPSEKLDEQIAETTIPAKYYDVMDGDTPALIAKKNDISIERLQDLNPDIDVLSESESALESGMQLIIFEQQQTIPVQVTHEETKDEDIKFERELVESDEFPKSYRKVTQTGEKGKRQITTRITLLNGEEINREILQDKVIKEPVTEKIIVGTAEPQKSDSIEASVGDGVVPDLIWPLDNHSTTSGYGSRWGSFHGGLDVVTSDGTFGAPVKAVADGVVVFNGYSGSYGYLMKIDHGDGVQSWYGHNSQNIAQPGDIVKQGDVISKAGSTGRSTGPHVHLEIRINGKRQNPANYLK